MGKTRGENIGRIYLLTLGCSKNRVDSEHLLRQIYESDIEVLVDDYDLSTGVVDAIIINTCGFIKDAKEESVEAIFQAIDAKSRGYAKRVFVFGCLSGRYLNYLKSSIPEVDGFFGAFDLRSVLNILGKDWNDAYSRSRYLTTPSHYAYLKISEGCDRICSYCAIPMIRGRHVSSTIEELVEEAELLADGGVKELILVAQDTTYYGLDLYGERKLAELMQRLSEIKSVEWIRLHYSYPAGFPESVLEVMRNNSKICKYLDIPLQHISDKVLSNMRRSIDGETTRRLVDKFRADVPDIALRTTMIVGHPGEDKRAFKELLSFVEEAKFERLGAFTYSEEEGTWGALNLKDSVSNREKQERLCQLMELQSSISLEYNLSRVGKSEYVILDSLQDNILVARSSIESPGVDGEILISSQNMDLADNYSNIIGKFATVRIESADEYDLSASIERVYN